MFFLTPAEDGLRNLTGFCACKCFLTVQPGSSGPRLLALGNVEALQAPESEAGLPGERGRLPSRVTKRQRGERVLWDLISRGAVKDLEESTHTDAEWVSQAYLKAKS